LASSLQVHLLSELPTTGSGKVLKTELRKCFMPRTATPAMISVPAEVEKETVAVPGMTALQVSACVMSALGGEGSGLQQLPLDQQQRLTADAAYLLPLVDSRDLEEQVGVLWGKGRGQWGLRQREVGV
jgi:hypothetical protein